MGVLSSFNQWREKRKAENLAYENFSSIIIDKPPTDIKVIKKLFLGAKEIFDQHVLEFLKILLPIVSETITEEIITKFMSDGELHPAMLPLYLRLMQEGDSNPPVKEIMEIKQIVWKNISPSIFPIDIRLNIATDVLNYECHPDYYEKIQMISAYLYYIVYHLNISMPNKPLRLQIQCFNHLIHTIVPMESYGNSSYETKLPKYLEDNQQNPLVAIEGIWKALNFVSKDGLHTKQFSWNRNNDHIKHLLNLDLKNIQGISLLYNYAFYDKNLDKNSTNKLSECYKKLESAQVTVINGKNNEIYDFIKHHCVNTNYDIKKTSDITNLFKNLKSVFSELKTIIQSNNTLNNL